MRREASGPLALLLVAVLAAGAVGLGGRAWYRAQFQATVSATMAASQHAARGAASIVAGSATGSGSLTDTQRAQVADAATAAVTALDPLRSMPPLAGTVAADQAQREQGASAAIGETARQLADTARDQQSSPLQLAYATNRLAAAEIASGASSEGDAAYRQVRALWIQRYAAALKQADARLTSALNAAIPSPTGEMLTVTAPSLQQARAASQTAEDQVWALPVPPEDLPARSTYDEALLALRRALHTSGDSPGNVDGAALARFSSLRAAAVARLSAPSGS